MALTGAALAGTLVAASLAGVQAAATTGGPAARDSLSYTARLVLGDTQRACSAVLVAPQWLATSAQCFADDLAQSPGHVSAGKPKWKTTATIGRTDLSTTSGQVREVVELVPRTDRDLVMARLDTPTTGIAPAPLALTPPAAGEKLTTAGYGRTHDQWAPLSLHTASGVTTSVDGVDLATEGATASDAVCAGDAGGPVLREVDGTLRLTAVNSRSWQGGCFGADAAETRTGAVSTRLDDITAWVQQVASLPQQGLPVGGDFDGDGKDDAAVLYDYGLDSVSGKRRVALWLHTSDGARLSAPRVVWQSEASSWTWSHVKLVGGDFDGDGRDDIGVFYDNGRDADGTYKSALWTFTSTGEGFAEPQRVWQSTGSWNWAASQPVAGDFDGDGKADVGVLYDYGKNATTGLQETGLWDFRSTGSGFAPPKKVWTSATSWTWSHIKSTAGDFDGDGKDDVGVLYDNGKDADGSSRTAWWTFAGTSTGVAAPQRVWQSTGSWDWAASRPVAGDFDGDGKADVGVLYDNGKNATTGLQETVLWTFGSTGSGFAAPKKVWTSATSWTWSRAVPFGADFDGDGKADVGVLYDNGLGTDGRRTYGLWRFTSTGTGVSAPVRDWFSSLS
ncbi:FG-GAP-like repeat-containing protein [Streptomyces sp. SID11385]|uniref:FG-GAP-like repeat-containing protein n=1 Tax=Streptomyces sp. SID11385 TaxID=2706031 RepID=UPI0013C983B2|nr:FG-GAP-like repeat-containing protein [Streptomyces sp. SID11385]NEA38515.1 trypsin-like serine protease [Streptomyces sp. SID11385]